MDRERQQQSSTGRRTTWQRPILLVLAVLLALGIGFGGGTITTLYFEPEMRQAVAETAPFLIDAPDVEEYGSVEAYREEKVELLWQIWDILRREYIDPEELDPKEMMYGAASGLVAEVGDPHTVFVEPVRAQIMSEDMQGSFEGIGATVNMVDGELTIVRPLPNSPAMEAGLQPGDVILEVDGRSIEGMDLIDAIALIRGPEGTVVRLLVRREGVEAPFVVPVERDKVKSPTIESRMIEGEIGYVRLTEFNAAASKRLEESIRDLLGNDPVGLVFDLRGNPGGYLQMAVEVAGEFLPKGTLVLTEEERGQPMEEYRVKQSGIATEIPLVVLVNGSSASASEIVAGAIRDHDRGTLIGQRTYGKGSVQNTHRLPDDSSLRVTIAKWYLPDGESLDGQGIEPDIPVERTPEDVAADRDPQLDRAVDYLRNGA